MKMSLTMKRYWYLILIGALFFWVLVYYWTYRVISVNIWDKWEVTTDYYNIENTIDLFDSTQVHEIKILMTDEEYKNMIDTYANTSEKDWYKTDVIIDWVLVSDVWIRLKWNRWLVWIKPIKWETPIDYSLKLPLFIHFDKYTNQTYQWHEMIVLRMEPDWWLFAEPYTYALYHKMWQPAPDESYWLVEINWGDKNLSIISEIPEDKFYIKKWFGDDNWILYKAWDLFDLVYLWENPMLYLNHFTQKTKITDYDLSPLIRMLKFVAESDDQEFEEKIDSYIDVKSVITLLAIDDFVGNRDWFWWSGSNYYLYYNIWEKKFYILTWDQNVAFQAKWRWIIRFGVLWLMWLQKIPWSWSIFWDIWSDFSPWQIEITWFNVSKNLLKTRLLENEKFKWLYDEIYAEVKKIAIDSDFSRDFFKEWGNKFLKYWNTKGNERGIILVLMQVTDLYQY